MANNTKVITGPNTIFSYLTVLEPKTPLGGGTQRRNILDSKPDQPGRHSIEHVSVCTGQQAADLPRRSLRGAVAFHANHRITDAEPGF